MESKVNSTLERWKILDLWHFVCRRFIRKNNFKKSIPKQFLSENKFETSYRPK